MLFFKLDFNYCTGETDPEVVTLSTVVNRIQELVSDAAYLPQETPELVGRVQYGRMADWKAVYAALKQQKTLEVDLTTDGCRSSNVMVIPVELTQLAEITEPPRCSCGCGCKNRNFDPYGSYCSACKAGCCGE